MGEGASRLLVRAEPVPESTLSNERQEKILNYIRERFGVPENVKLILSAWHASAAVPGYDESMVSVGDGKNLRSQPVLVSRDQRYLVVVMGKIVDVPEDSPTVMVQQLRAAFKTPATLKMSLGPFRRSVSPEL